MTLELVHRLATDDSPATKRDSGERAPACRPEHEPRRPDDGHRLVQPEPGTPFEVSPLPHLYHQYAGHDLNRDMYMLTQKESQYIARLAWQDWLPVHVAGSAPDEQQRRPDVRDAGGRSDQPERSSADLPVERHPRPVAGGGARSGGQGRHHLQLDLHELLAGTRWRGAAGGTTRSACSPKSPAPGSRRRSSSFAPAPGSPARPTAGAAAGSAPRFDSAPLLPPTDIVAAHRVSAAVDGRPLDAQGHRRLQLIATDGAARNGGRSARDDPAADLRDQPADRRRAPARRAHGDPDRP